MPRTPDVASESPARQAVTRIAKLAHAQLRADKEQVISSGMEHGPLDAAGQRNLRFKENEILIHVGHYTRPEVIDALVDTIGEMRDQGELDSFLYWLGNEVPSDEQLPGASMKVITAAVISRQAEMLADAKLRTDHDATAQIEPSGVSAGTRQALNGVDVLSNGGAMELSGS